MSNSTVKAAEKDTDTGNISSQFPSGGRSKVTVPRGRNGRNHIVQSSFRSNYSHLSTRSEREKSDDGETNVNVKYKVSHGRNGSNHSDQSSRGSNYSRLSTKDELEKSDDGETNVNVKSKVNYPDKICNSNIVGTCFKYLIAIIVVLIQFVFLFLEKKINTLIEKRMGTSKASEPLVHVAMMFLNKATTDKILSMM